MSNFTSPVPMQAGRSIDRHSNRTWIAKTDLSRFFKFLFVISTLFNSIFASFSPSDQFTFLNFCSLQLVILTAALIFNSLIRNDQAAFLKLNNPIALYGIFFSMYYLLPYIGALVGGELTDEIKLRIAALFFIGYIGCCWGILVASGNIKREISDVPMRISKRNAQALLLVCFLCAFVILYRYVVRTSQGIFFTHARYYQSGQDVGSSLIEVFAGSLELPIILILGLLAAIPGKGIAKASYFFMLFYSSSLTLIYVLSSQTRPAVTTMLFAMIGLQLCNKIAIKIRHLLLLGAVAFGILMIIQGVRISDDTGFVSSENQFLFALENTFSHGFASATAQHDDIAEMTISRATGGITTLREIIEAIDSNKSHLYGQGIMQMTPSLLPRFLWPDKGLMTSPSMSIRMLLDLPLHDSILSGVAQFYVEGGWIAVFFGMFASGLFLGKVSDITLRSGRVEWWLILVFLWSHVSQMELELVVGTITTLRSAFVLYVVYQGFVFLIPKKQVV